MIWFVICQDKKCAHCKNIKPSRATKYLQRLGGRLFQPIKSEEHEGHYLTFIDTDAKFRQDTCDIPGSDADQPFKRHLVSLDLISSGNYASSRVSMLLLLG